MTDTDDLGDFTIEIADQIESFCLAIREIDAGSCNGCELEIHALNNAVYDVERFGIKFAASPRHADVLLVTGPVTKNMREALERTYVATPDPKWVVAVGDCAANGGIYAGSYAVEGGVSKVVPQLKPLRNQVARGDPEYRNQRQECARIGRRDMTQPGHVEEESEPVVQDA